MPATVYVVARYLAKPGKEREVEGILTALVTPSRREIGCYQYDLLRNASDPCDFCLVERWGDDRAIDQHTATEHVKNTIEQVGGLVEVPPDIRRYFIL